MTAQSGPSLKYPGAKWRCAPWIISHLPQHVTYVEPFFGSGAVFFSKPPSRVEYINDLDGDVANLFRVLRERGPELAALIDLTPYSRAEYELSWEPCADELERARRTLVRHWGSIGGNGGGRSTGGWRHSGPKAARSKSCVTEWDRLPDRLLAHARRLKQAHIEQRPALEVLGRLNHPSVLAYIDPPYHADTRTGRMYREEMLDEAAHVELLSFLVQDWQGMAVVSGYPHPLYDDLLSGWARATRETVAEMSQVRTEVLWLNPAATRATLFGGIA
ncbi:DNA adenine methylase [Deinococcus sp. S9]|uniref:DNA adenine methylase n=1 Tax=Deinococcus sp. S9 TaxID=2545754 RepID=UPI0019804B84|nr:DNA adenine methylase [Deinococcus sp. S9]